MCRCFEMRWISRRLLNRSREMGASGTVCRSRGCSRVVWKVGRERNECYLNSSGEAVVYSSLRDNGYAAKFTRDGLCVRSRRAIVFVTCECLPEANSETAGSSCWECDPRTIWT